MEAFQQCVIDEEADLSEKIAKLESALNGDVLITSTKDRVLLTLQLVAMKNYQYILNRRIARF